MKKPLDFTLRAFSVYSKNEIIMSNKKFLLVIGHTDGSDGGAEADYLNASEFKYWSRVLQIVQNYRTDCELYTHHIQPYGKRQDELAAYANKQNFDLVLEFHFNYADRVEANGTECLYFHTSSKSKAYAQIIADTISDIMGTRKRGYNGLVPSVKPSDRGNGFLRKLSAPAVIIEPFFGSNIEDQRKFADVDMVVHAINKALDLCKEKAK